MATIQKRKGVLDRDDKERVIMSLRNLITLCEEDGLYEYPEMNNKIYLHYKGFHTIENLDKFINLKTIYLENNMISKITGLENLKFLQHLFLQHNTIKQIEGLDENKELITLNLSHNMITRIEGLANQTKLENLSIGSNLLSNFESVENLKQLPSLSCCGLEDNQITYDSRILDEVFSQMGNLKVLYLKGNDYSREFPYYRKKMIGTLKELTYLDDRPVFPEERVVSEAFTEGGKEKMQSVLKDINDKKIEAKKVEQIENQKKNAEIKQRRIIFFETNLKKSLIELETLKKKLNRAHQINDPYLIIQLEEEIKKQNGFIEDIESTLKLMREGQKQLQSAKSENKENNNENCEDTKQSSVNTHNNKDQSFIQRTDIEKLLNSLLLGSTNEEDFDEDNMIRQLENTITEINTKIGKNDFNFREIFDDSEVKQKVKQFKDENPDYLVKIKEKRFKQHNNNDEENYDIIESKDSHNQNLSQNQQENYLDDLE